MINISTPTPLFINLKSPFISGNCINTKAAAGLALLFTIASPVLVAACRTPLPPAAAFAMPDGGSCPSGYYASGKACVPSSASSRYAFYNSGGSCPGGYYSSGKACVAAANSSCYAFFNGGGSCPSGFYSSGNGCVSN